MKKLPLLLVFALGLSSFLLAQNYYTIQVGTFLEAKKSDFEAIQPVGFVHADKTQGELYIVRLGGYTSRDAAEKAWAQVRAKGYSNAFIQERTPAEGQEVAVIQLATKSAVQPVDWENYTKAEPLYAILDGNSLKIVTGPYQNVEVAKQQLNSIRQMGFSDAFIKTVNTVFLTQINGFETGIKKPLIPFEMSQQPTVNVPTQNVPNSFENTGMTPRTPIAGATAKTVSQPVLPRIRTNVKRRSVLELQKVLKGEGYYKSSLDGYYGSGTSSAFDAMWDNNRELQKYIVLAQHIDPASASTTPSPLQDAINNLPSDPLALRTIERSNEPIAKAYQAYILYNSMGPSGDVNQLMNSAIREAFVGKKLTSAPPFDYRSTYAYDNLEQLLLHLHYIHSAPDNNIAAPCWLFQRHPREMQRVFQRYASVATPDFLLQACDQFLSWEELSVTQTIAVDLNPVKKLDQKELSQAASIRAMLFLAPEALDNDVAKELDTWNDKLWIGLNGWATRDPGHQRTVTAFKTAYFQSQVRLEDFFMDKGFNAGEAKTLALATLRTIVGYHLERFIG